MAKEICISSTPHETRLAILEDDQLAEIYYERENEYTLAGSIYNGRVTRVLPGMQSAFVDVGLERDAFLYVTDFLEMEDPEETDELEQAATTGVGPQIREVRGGRGEEPVQRAEQKPAPRQEAKPEPRQEKQEKPERQEKRPDRPDRSAQRRMTVEAVPAVVEEQQVAAPVSALAASEDELLDGDNEPGARRWRGRRRRRGGRSGAGETAPQQTGASQESVAEPVEEFETLVEEAVVAETLVIPQIQATAAPTPVYSAPAPRAEQKPFVLPGESLSKYGGTAAVETQAAAAPVAAPKPASTFKPATLIETPLAWDGSGLLPGESLSRHRNRQAEPAVEVDGEPQGVFADATEVVATPVFLSEEENFVEETVEFEQEAAAEPFVGATPEAAAEDEFVEEEMVEEELSAHVESVSEPFEAAEEAPVVEEADASASHNIDPSAPTGFRLFGLGSKKKKEDTKAGQGEEDFIEEEEFAAPAPAARAVKAPETKQPEAPRQQNRNNDRTPAPRKPEQSRILVDFEDKDDDEFDLDEENGGDEQSADETPAQNQARRDRGGRGRKGRTPGQPSSQPSSQPSAPSPAAARRGPSRRSAQTQDLPIISDLLKPGQEILVQIAKEPIAKKGARITSHIALPGRFLVFMPTVSHVGVSRKIASDEERQRLKRILISERGENAGGFIVRTAAEGASEEDLRADLRFLLHLWDEIKTRSDSSKSPALIYHDLSLIERILRDQVSSNFSNIWVDSEADYERIVRFLNRFSPSLVRRVKLYTKETPLFEHFGIQDEISKALRSKVWLKSGGSIVINQTEALVAIDINTGKYVGKSSRLEDTIVKTNLDAVPEIVRQIRLRDLGGIIVIDFIDMDDRKNRYKVMAALEEALKSDRAPTKVLQFNDFGLVAITRKRVKQSLERTLSVPCPTCQATGMVKSPLTVCNEIYIEMRKMKKHFEAEDVLLRVHPETVKVLKSNNAAWITEFEELVGKNILIKSDATLHPEQFDIQG